MSEYWSSGQTLLFALTFCCCYGIYHLDFFYRVIFWVLCRIIGYVLLMTNDKPKNFFRVCVNFSFADACGAFTYFD